MNDGRVPRLRLSSRYHTGITPGSTRRLLCWLLNEPLGIAEYLAEARRQGEQPPPGGWLLRRLWPGNPSAWDVNNPRLSGLLRAALRLNFYLPLLVGLLWLLPAVVQLDSLGDRLPYWPQLTFHYTIFLGYWLLAGLAIWRGKLATAIQYSAVPWTFALATFLLGNGFYRPFVGPGDDLRHLLDGALLGLAAATIAGYTTSLLLSAGHQLGVNFRRFAVHAPLVWGMCALILLGPTNAVPAVVGLFVTATAVSWLWLLRPLPALWLIACPQPPGHFGALGRVPFASPLPNKKLMAQLALWLKNDWEMGFANLLEVWQFTAQEATVLAALAQYTGGRQGNQLVERVAEIARTPTLARGGLPGLAWLLYWLYRGQPQGWRAFADSTALSYGPWPPLPKEEPKPDAQRAFGIFFFLLMDQPDLARNLFKPYQYRSEFKELSETVGLLAKIRRAKLPEIHTDLKFRRPFRPLTSAGLWDALERFRKSAYYAWLAQHTPLNHPQRDNFLDEAEAALHPLVRRPLGLAYARRIVRRSAGSWLNKLADISKYEPSRPDKNPLQFADATRSTDYLAGRKQELAALALNWQKADQMRPVRICGLPGMGKSALIRQAQARFAREMTVVAVDLYGLADRSGSTQTAAMEAVIQHIARAVEEATGVGGPPSFYGDACAVLQDYLARVTEQTGERRLAICLDNCERMYDWNSRYLLPDEFFTRLHYAIANLAHVTLALIDCHCDDTAPCLEDFEGELLALPLANLTAADVDDLLERISYALPVFVSPQARQAVFQYTDGWPALAGFLAHQAVQDFIARCGPPPPPGLMPIIEESDIDRLVQDPGTIQRATTVCKPIFAFVQADIAHCLPVLQEMAQINSQRVHIPTLEQRLQQRAPAISPQQTQNVLRSLARYNLLRHTPPTCAFAAELFRRWLVYYV